MNASTSPDDGDVLTPPKQRSAKPTHKDVGIGTGVDFVRSDTDWESSTGLKNADLEGGKYHTPVFFNREVLLKHALRKKYSVQYFRNGGKIAMPNGVIMEYGINNNGKIICWHGSLGKIPKDEQHYWRSENTESDHELKSGIFDGVRPVLPSAPTAEQDLVMALHSLVAAGKRSWMLSLYDLREEENRMAKGLSGPIVWELVALAVNDLEKICVESINAAEILDRVDTERARSRSGHTRSLKKINLLKNWFEERLGQNINIDLNAAINPLFALNAWRNALDHRSDTRLVMELDRQCRRIGVDSRSEPDVMYGHIVKKITTSYITLARATRAARSP